MNDSLRVHRLIFAMLGMLLLGAETASAGIVIRLGWGEKKGCICIGSKDFCEPHCKEAGVAKATHLDAFKGDVVVTSKGRAFKNPVLNVGLLKGDFSEVVFAPQNSTTTRAAAVKENTDVSKVMITNAQTGESISLKTLLLLLRTCQETQGNWTRWLNRDNPGGSGDYETLNDFLKEGMACQEPLAIECQTLNGKPWKTTEQVYTCDAARGGICQNSKQSNGGRCLDYRVRFLCP